MELIDCHTHIFPPEIISKRTEAITRDNRFASIYRGSKERLVDAEGLKDYMRLNSVSACVACAFSFRDSGLMRLSNDYIIEASRQDKRIVPFIAVDFDRQKEAIKEIERCFRGGAKGIGEIGFYEKKLGIKEIKRLEGMAEFAEHTGCVVMLHVNEQIGHTYNGKMPVDLVALTDFISRHRNMKIILAHLGGGLCFYEFMPEVKDAFENVYYDIAAAPFIYSDDIYRFIGRFLTKKILFGTDFPLLTTKRYKRGLMTINRREREAIFYKNAGRLFGRG